MFVMFILWREMFCYPIQIQEFYCVSFWFTQGWLWLFSDVIYLGMSLFLWQCQLLCCISLMSQYGWDNVKIWVWFSVLDQWSYRPGSMTVMKTFYQQCPEWTGFILWGVWMCFVNLMIWALDFVCWHVYKWNFGLMVTI